MEAGTHFVVWNAQDASGVYSYRMETGGFVKTTKLVLMR